MSVSKACNSSNYDKYHTRKILVDESSNFILTFFFTFNIVDSNNISKEDERNETEIFIKFEETLRTYLEDSDHFTVEPKLVYVDVDLNMLNEFLLCDRPGDFFLQLI
jgi:hypothetical protein